MSSAPAPADSHVIVVASTFTSEPLASPLSAWLRWLGMTAEICFAPYNQVFQQLLDSNSLIATNSAGTNIFLICIEDWSRGDDRQATARHAEEFARAMEKFSTGSNAQTLLVLCPSAEGSSSVGLSDEAQLEVRNIEAKLLQRLSNCPRTQVIGSSEVSELYPVSAIHDELSKRAGHIPYTHAYFTALATFLARWLYAQQRPLAKVIVLDCDNTLWDGVCGEIGPQNVDISPARLGLQEQLLQLRERGFLLCLCSKNNPVDAWTVFEEHPHMLLKRQHITAAQFNWEPKSANLRELARQLNLGLDSFVFIDDSPLEIAEVRAHVPEVLALQLPNCENLVQFMRHVWPLDRWSETHEDRRRAEMYTHEAQRIEARKLAPSLEQFLSQLELRVDFVPLAERNLERASQLTQRTNQFNFTSQRRTVSELRLVLNSPRQHAFLVQAADKFGDYGLVGLVVYEVTGDEATEWGLCVDTLLLSCRALGRRIELQMLSEVSRRAQQAGVTQIEFQFVNTGKNQPAQNFAKRNLEHFKVTSEHGLPVLRYVLTAGQLEEVIASGTDAVEGEVTSEQIVRRVPTAERRGTFDELLYSIAADFNSVESILDKLRGEALPRPALEEPYVPPRTAVERGVTSICQEVLEFDQIGVHDGLKNLGASSLQIVRIYSRLEHEFSAGLSITDLFSLPTIQSIVQRVEELSDSRKQSGEFDPQTATASTTWRQRLPMIDSSGIAIIGMAGRFPGASNVDEFWQNITGGVCSIVDISEAELNLPVDSPLRKNPNLVRKAASVRDADKFDAKFFGIFPKEATVMDPQHRLLLENCWHAIEDAGYNVDALDVPVGVFAGCYMDTYMLASLALSPKWLESLANAFHGGDLLTELGNDKDYLATRVAFLLNLRGPALTVQTACSTSLVAIAQACQSLQSGQCHMALAGGATLKLPQNRGYLYTEGGMVSPDGVCRTFDAQARGTVFGEGCGVVLLKRVEDAVADGDDIYAVIKGWGLNNDGHTKLGYTAPSVEGQAGAIEMAHRTAGVSAESISLVEAHGTGTSLGDPIEIESLTRVFRKSTDQKQYCAIGSVKTNIGHLDVAAGVTGLIKTSLALRHRVLPPSLNYEQPNPNIDFPNSPFFVNTRLCEWAVPSPRRAGLSSFGVGGTNAHVVVEEAPPPAATSRSSGPQLLILSARSQAALDAQRATLIEHLQQHPQLDLADVAYTLQTGRKTFSYSLVAISHTTNEATELLREQTPQRLIQQRQIRRGKSVVFMFPGQGSQHLNMARDLFDDDTVFRRHFEDCVERLVPHVGFDLRDKLFAARDEQAALALNQTAVAQTSIFSVAYALSKRLESSGIRPTQMIGHSVGEFVAACLADVVSLEDALRLVAFRANYMQRLPAGSMLAVRLSEADLTARLPSRLSLAAINGPLLCVVSGPTADVEQLQTQLEAEEVVCRSLHTSHAFHSAMMDEVVEPFAEQLRQVSLRPPRVPIISSVTGQLLSDAQAVDPWYWARHLRETVRFTDAVAQVMQNPDAVLLEVGPGQTLSTLARQHPARDSEQGVFSALPHSNQQSSAREHLLLTLGRLWQSGVDVDWKRQFHGSKRLRLHLPGYPFERQRYWLERDEIEAEVDDFSDVMTTESTATETNAAVPLTTVSPSGGPTVPMPTVPMATGDEIPPPSHAAADDMDAMTHRVIQQQLQLMKQQLEAWHS